MSYFDASLHSDEPSQTARHQIQMCFLDKVNKEPQSHLQDWPKAV